METAHKRVLAYSLARKISIDFDVPLLVRGIHIDLAGYIMPFQYTKSLDPANKSREVGRK